MRAAGIEGVRNGMVKRTTFPGLSPVAAEDLVRRDFTALRPDAVWLSDFTYIRTWEGWSYLAIVLDVHTRRIVGWQYTSYEYTERLKKAGIAPSRGRTGSALDNAMAESVMSTLKRELTKRHTWRTRLDLELALVSYIGWYNARRKHRSLQVVVDGLIRRQTPLEAFERYNQEVAMPAVASN